MAIGLIWMVDILNGVSTASTTVFVTVAIITILYFFLSFKRLPPGPIGVPYLGYWPFLNSKTCLYKLDALKTKYGDVFSFTSSGRLYVNLGTTKAIREAYITKVHYFGSRVQEFGVFSVIFEEGVSLSNGEPWKEIRRFFHGLLKQRGRATNEVLDSVQSTVDHLKALNGQPEDMVQLLIGKCNDILRHVLFGETGITEEQVRQINELYTMAEAIWTPTNLLVTGKFAKFLFEVVPSNRRAMKRLKKIVQIVYKIIDDHKSSYNEGHIRDVIDAYIKEKDLRKRKGDPTADHFTDKALMATLVQIIGDGVLSVAEFITFFLKKAIEHPEEQEKMYQEIVEVVGLERQVTVNDRRKLPYCNAFMLEVLRQTYFFPFLPSRQCTKETTLSGYRIPVGAITLFNIRSAHNDPEQYEDPERFNPSRFLKKNFGKGAELPVAFGVGRRLCIGEGFTMMQVFLFLTALVKNFNLSLVKQRNDPDSEMITKEMQVVAIPRVTKH